MTDRERSGPDRRPNVGALPRCGSRDFGHIGSEDGLVVGGQRLGQFRSRPVVVEALRQLQDAIERAGVTSKRLLAQHHEGSFLG